MTKIKIDLQSYIRSAGKTWPAFRIPLDRDLAKKFLDSMRNNRPIREKAVMRYRMQIRDRNWGFTGQPIIFNTHWQMMDGQHRCIAVIHEDAEVDVLVVTGIDDDSFKFMDQGVLRSGSDFINGTPNAVSVAAALGWIYAEDIGSIASKKNTLLLPSQMEEQLTSHPDISECVTRGLSLRHLLPGSLAGYCIYRMRKVSEAKCDEFIEQLRSGANLSPRSPALTLRNRLVDNRSSKSRLPQNEILALVIKAWTKFLAGNEVGTLRWRNIGPTPEEFPRWPQ